MDIFYKPISWNCMKCAPAVPFNDIFDARKHCKTVHNTRKYPTLLQKPEIVNLDDNDNDYEWCWICQNCKPHKLYSDLNSAREHCDQVHKPQCKKRVQNIIIPTL